MRVLIVNCLSHIYDKLCDAVCASVEKAHIKYELIKINYNQLDGVLESELEDIDCVVFSGSTAFSSPDLTDVSDAAKLMQMAIDKDKYCLAVCFGLQMLAYVLEKRNLVHVGAWAKDVEINIVSDDPVLDGVSSAFITRQFHNYAVPHGRFKNAKILATSKDGIEIMRVGNLLATQFHPESSKASKDAIKILENYFMNIAK